MVRMVMQRDYNLVYNVTFNLFAKYYSGRSMTAGIINNSEYIL